MITADDVRHGSRAGFLAGCGEPCCRTPKNRYQKLQRVRRQLEGPQIIPAADLLERTNWWMARGVTLQALTDASGLGYGTLAEAVAGERDVCLRSTERALLALTWDDLPDRVFCGAALTRHRIFSLMAAGHPLHWIAEQTNDKAPIGGRWRYQERVTLGTARAVMRTYHAAPLDGPSKITQVKARNKGHRHPLAWDDPGVPAVPDNDPVFSPSRMTAETVKGRFDEMVVERVLNGEWHLRASNVEKREVARRWYRNGGSLEELARRTGWNVPRYYKASEAA